MSNKELKRVSEEEAAEFERESGIKIPVVKKTNFFLTNLLSLFIYFLSYFTFYFFKFGKLSLSGSYETLFYIYFVSLITGLIISNKFRLTRQHTFLETMRKLYTALLISLGLMTFLLYELDINNISRFFLLGSVIIGFLAESIAYFFLNEFRFIKLNKGESKVSLNYILMDFMILGFITYFLYISQVVWESDYEKHALMIFAIFFSWILSAVISHGFNPIGTGRNVWKIVAQQLKFYLLMAALVSIAVFLLQFPTDQRNLYLWSIGIYSFWSFFFMIIFYAGVLPVRTDEVRGKILNAFELREPEIAGDRPEITGKYKFRSFRTTTGNGYLELKLSGDYFKNEPELFDFINRRIDLDSFTSDKCVILRSSDPYNVDVLGENSIEMFVNLHDINDLRRINEYFIKVNNRLQYGGIYLGCLEPVNNRYERFHRKYPFLLAVVFYTVDFMWKRVTPKIPLLRKIYFAFTKGKDRALSLAEGLGRLVYCGFDVMDLKEINGLVYYAARKDREPSTDKNPSYSPIFKMRRSGKNGELIFVYKLRTMHPYSEYLQDFIYKHHNLDKGGKFKDDFRVTAWGKVFRKMWIDELPMLINWVRRELKLVGVRPLSKHYLCLYSDEYRERRNRYKPGLIPPYYADMPDSIQEIQLSEERYLDSYEKNPILTDIKYFFKAGVNILIRKKRSG